MSTFTEDITTKFHVVSCYTCGVPFGISSRLYRRVVTDATGSVYCPACGSRTCWRESESDKKLRELENELRSANTRTEMANRREQNQREARERAENSLRATKGVVTKMKKRIGKGVCPCCNRHFENLQRHMESKHPGYSEELSQ